MEYNVYMRIVSADNFRYKFLGSRWVAMGESEVMQNEERQIVKHPSSPNLGSFWMKKPISFKSVKITHHPQSKLGNVSVRYIQSTVIEHYCKGREDGSTFTFHMPAIQQGSV